jgi:1,4-alpha-glucan branching enzyme
MMRSKYYSVLLTVVTIFSTYVSSAQIVTTSPLFPTRTSTVTVTYDATKGNAALVGVTPVYAHTGLITDQSYWNGSPPTWEYIQGNWGTADSRMLMTDIGNDKHTITFNVASFYNDNSTDTVYKLAFVFRNTDGSIVGRTALGGDIYANIYSDSLHCAFFSPASGSVTAATLNSTMNFFCAASQNCTMTLTANGNQLMQVTNDSLVYNNFNFLSYGNYHFVLTATNGTQTAADSVDVIVNPSVVQQDPPAGVIEGINYIDDSTVVLALLAPNKNFVYLLGDFNNWVVDPNYLMHKSLNGQLYWLQVSHLTPQKQYAFQYDVDGAIRIGDPYSELIADPNKDQNIPSSTYPNLPVYPTGKTTGIATILQTAQVPYVWTDTNFVRPNKHNMVVYELLVRDFQSSNNYTKLMDSLDYLQTLGINTIELMPIMNFESSSSWGYDPNYYCAPDKSYGTQTALKNFITACHKRGIAVLLDIAFNDAFESCPMVMMYWDNVLFEPAANNPWFNPVAPHPYSVGYDFNHNSVYTQNFLDRVTKYWIQQYHADGYRFDLTKGYTQFYSGNDVGLWGQLDTMRVRLLERMVDKIWDVDSGAIVVFEELANNDEQILLQAHNKGILLWGNLNSAYNQNTMGYNSNADISGISYQNLGWGNANLVGYMESHDEERLMYNNELYGDSLGGYDVKSIDTGLARMECAGALFFPVPGPKMLWMFGERGYDISINYNGRINPKPSHWEYMKNNNRLHLYKVWSALIKLKINYPGTFTTTNYNIDMGNVVKRMWLVKPTAADFDAQVIGNFDVDMQTAAPYFQHTGWWYDYMTGDSMNVTDANMTITMKPGEYHVYTDRSLPVPDLSLPPVPNGIDEIYSQDNIAVYPQPTQGVVHFESEDNSAIQKVSIYDLQGRLVMEQNYGAGYSGVSITLPGNLNSGMYLYALSVDNVLHNGKILYTK